MCAEILQRNILTLRTARVGRGPTTKDVVPNFGLYLRMRWVQLYSVREYFKKKLSLLRKTLSTLKFYICEDPYIYTDKMHVKQFLFKKWYYANNCLLRSCILVLYTCILKNFLNYLKNIFNFLKKPKRGDGGEL